MPDKSEKPDESDKVRECERRINEILSEYDCTLIYEEVRHNGELKGFAIRVLPKEH